MSLADLMKDYTTKSCEMFSYCGEPCDGDRPGGVCPLYAHQKDVENDRERRKDEERERGAEERRKKRSKL